VGRQGERIRRTTFIPHGSGLLGRIVDEVVVMVSGLVDRGSDRGDGVALPDLRDRARRWGVGPTRPRHHGNAWGAVSLADGISGLLANPERLAKVAHTARVVAKQCTWGHRASQYQQLYEALR